MELFRTVHVYDGMRCVIKGIKTMSVMIEQLNIIKLIVQTAKETGRLELAQLVGLLRANHVAAEELPRILKELKPYLQQEGVIPSL